MPSKLNKKILILFGLLVILLPAISLKYPELNNLLNKLTLQTSTSFFCPSEERFCQEGRNITLKEQYLGFGAELAPNSPIYALLPGKTTIFKTLLSTNMEEEVNTIYIDQKDGTRAVYFFKGQVFAPPEVKTGDLIGKVEQKINSFNASLVVQVIKASSKGKKTILTAKDFGY